MPEMTLSQQEQQDLSKVLWEARELISMFSDVVERRIGTQDKHGRSVIQRIDDFRKEKWGQGISGFGGEGVDPITPATVKKSAK